MYIKTFLSLNNAKDMNEDFTKDLFKAKYYKNADYQIMSDLIDNLILDKGDILKRS